MVNTQREIWYPIPLRLWKRDRQYLGVITDERSIKLLTPYVGKTVVLKIGDIYIDGTLLKVKHGQKYELEVVLPRRLALTWEKLRSGSIEHDAVIIVELKDNEEWVV